MVPSSTQEKPKDSDQFEWVTIEQSGELVYEAPESIAAEPPPINKQQSQTSSSSSSSVQTMSPIPAHSLAAFGLFLRLPGYAEVLLKERKHAQCLLRLVLGVTDDGEGSKSENASQLSTLKFTLGFELLACEVFNARKSLRIAKLFERKLLQRAFAHSCFSCLSPID